MEPYIGVKISIKKNPNTKSKKKEKKTLSQNRTVSWNNRVMPSITMTRLFRSGDYGATSSWCGIIWSLSGYPPVLQSGLSGYPQEIS